MKGKKGQAIFDQLGGIFISIAVVAVAMTLAFLMIAEGKDKIVEVEGLDTTNTSAPNYLTSSAAWNGTTEIQQAAADSVGWIGLAITIMVMVALIALIMVLKNRT